MIIELPIKGKAMENLIEGLQREINRCRELAAEYDRLPNGVGVFGATAIRNEIIQAEQAIASGDTVLMMRLFRSLEESN